MQSQKNAIMLKGFLHSYAEDRRTLHPTRKPIWLTGCHQTNLSFNQLSSVYQKYIESWSLAYQASIIQIIFEACYNRSWNNRSLNSASCNQLSRKHNNFAGFTKASLDLLTLAWCLVKYFPLSGNIKISCWRGHNVPSGVTTVMLSTPDSSLDLETLSISLSLSLIRHGVSISDLPSPLPRSYKFYFP